MACGGITQALVEQAYQALLARGEPMVWVTGTGLVVGLLMVFALVGVVFYQGLVTFWPGAVLIYRPPCA